VPARAAPNGTARLLDGSRGSLASPHAAARLHAQLGARASSHRIIVVLHDPAALAWALWRALRKDRGLDAYSADTSFTQKVLTETRDLARCFATQGRRRLTRAAAAAAKARARGRGNGSALEEDPSEVPFLAVDAWSRCLAVACGWGGCVTGAGLFAPQLRAWHNVYPAEQFAIFTLNEMHARPDAVVARARAFLGLGSGGANSSAGGAAARADGDEGCATEYLRTEAAAALRRGEGAPAEAQRALQRFHAPLSTTAPPEPLRATAPLRHKRCGDGYRPAAAAGAFTAR
jgi:hypothetical protein